MRVTHHSVSVSQVPSALDRYGSYRTHFSVSKENLVEDPRDWPGFHCAQSLVAGEPIQGHWFDGTGYGKEKYRLEARGKGHELNRDDHIYPTTFSFDKLPAFAHLSDEEYRSMMLELVEEVIEERKQVHPDKPALGRRAVCELSTRTQRPVPEPPWFEERKRLITWDDPEATEVADYTERYWDHQVRFRRASHAWRHEKPGARELFPDYCFIPGFRPRPIAHMEQSSG